MTDARSKPRTKPKHRRYSFDQLTATAVNVLDRRGRVRNPEEARLRLALLRLWTRALRRLPAPPAPPGSYAEAMQKDPFFSRDATFGRIEAWAQEGLALLPPPPPPAPGPPADSG